MTSNNQNNYNQDNNCISRSMASSHIDMLMEYCIDMLQGIAVVRHPNTTSPTADQIPIKQAAAKQTTSDQIPNNQILAEQTHSYGVSPHPPQTKTSSNILQHIEQTIAKCVQCQLCQERTHTVPGIGVHNPTVLIVGEAPGAEEDMQGKPFVGKSGAYLDKWLASIGLDRNKNVYITNTVKCRPPKNRNPLPEEIQHCNIFLKEQIHILKPKLILALGKVAGVILTGMENVRIDTLREQIFEYEGIPLYITYHPSAVLRNPNGNPDGLKRLVWNDLQKIQLALKSLESV